MSDILPVTVAQMLESELSEVLGVEAQTHTWEIAEAHIPYPQLLLDRIRENPYSKAYVWIVDQLRPGDEQLWVKLNNLVTGKLLDRTTLRTSMVTRAMIYMHEQVEWEIEDAAAREADPNVPRADAIAAAEAAANDTRRVNRSILEELFPGEIVRAEHEHLAATLTKLKKRAPSALCLSGGGIRSATFALGILQGLAQTGDKDTNKYPLEEIDYLSTVSGGGYIGGWLSAWIMRSPHVTTAEVFAALRGETESERDPVTSPPSSLASPLSSPLASPMESPVELPRESPLKSPPESPLASPSTSPLTSPPALPLSTIPGSRRVQRGIEPEAKAIRWLREYSNYLAPRLSIFSVDTATLVATWVRNVLINWLTFIPFLVLLMLLPRLMVSLVTSQASGSAAPGIAGATLTVLGIALIALARPALLEQNRPGRAKLIAAARLSIYAAALTLTLFWAGLHYDNVAIIGFLLFGALLPVAGVTGHVAGMRKLVARGEVPALLALGMLAAAAISGATGGLLLYLLTRWSWLRLPVRWPELYTLVAPPAFLVAFLLASTTFTALASRVARNEVHEYWNRLGASIILAAVAYLLVCGISFYGPFALALSPELLGAIGGLTGLIGIVLGSSGISPAGDKADLGRTVSDHVTAVLIAIFVVILLSTISWLISSLFVIRWPGEFPNVRIAGLLENPGAVQHLMIVRSTPISEVLLLTFATVLLAFGASFFADVNKFSMHNLYRMRLVRAYLGASNRERNPDPFTGFDKNDSVLLTELRGQKPFHIVNMALNLVRGKQLAWQQRKASTFTASPLYWGNWKLGYRPSDDYGKPLTGLDLGTAMTISGAAATPNMGYHSSAPLSFLLAMFNVRLGAWLGNPGAAGGRLTQFDRLFKLPPPWQRSSPKSSITHQLAEALGMTDDDHQYVYLSDGGHFENLGLYEMVLRRCRYVIVSDAGADPDLNFQDLGNAVRKIRIDFGVPIEFNRFTLAARPEKQPGAHCAIGRIRYSAVDGTPRRRDGHVLYIKASYYATGPQDVRQYARKVRDFPHESTADQFFTESQFESYRKLGEWVIETIMARRKPATIRQLFDAARRYERGHQEVLRW